MESAERLTRQRGYDGFSFADLSAEIGIRKPSIHHHFATKADLALAIMRDYRARFSQHLDAIDQESRVASHQLARYLAIYREASAGGETLCLCIALCLNHDMLSAPLRAEIAAFHEMSLSWLERVFDRGSQDGSIPGITSPGDEAAACLALVEGGQLCARAARSVEAFDRAVAIMANRL